MGAALVSALLAFAFSRGVGTPPRPAAPPSASAATATVPPSAQPSGESDTDPDDDPIPDAEPLVATPNTAVIPALMAQFRKVDLLALGERPSTAEDSAIRLALVRHRLFPRRVGIVVVHFANARYQELLDRYLNGEEMPAAEYQKVWREALQPGPLSPVYDRFLQEVRNLNAKLPVERRIRVLAAGPPIDWSKINSPEQVKPYLDQVESLPAELIAKEVLAKKRKALVIVPAAQVWRNTLGILTPDDQTLASRLEKDFPGRLFTILRLGGRYKGTRTLETLIAGAPPPVVFPLAGTGFGKLDANAFLGRDLPVHFFAEGLALESVADACIYTGSRADRIVNTDPKDPLDRRYAVEWARRRQLLKK